MILPPSLRIVLSSRRRRQTRNDKHYLAVGELPDLDWASTQWPPRVLVRRSGLVRAERRPPSLGRGSNKSSPAEANAAALDFSGKDYFNICAAPPQSL